MRISPSASRMYERSLMREISTSKGGCVSRSFIAGIRLWPPARIFASSFWASRLSASSIVFARLYSNDAGIMIAPFGVRRLVAAFKSADKSAHSKFLCVDQFPNFFGSQRHVDVGHPVRRQRINH